MTRDPRTLAPRADRPARPEPPTKPLPPRGTCRSCGKFTPGFTCAVCAMKGERAFVEAVNRARDDEPDRSFVKKSPRPMKGPEAER